MNLEKVIFFSEKNWKMASLNPFVKDIAGNVVLTARSVPIQKYVVTVEKTKQTSWHDKLYS